MQTSDIRQNDSSSQTITTEQSVIEQNSVIPSKKSKKVLFMIVIFIFVLSLGGYLTQVLRRNLNSETNIAVPLLQSLKGAIATPTPTPLPFVELTIPYLREKKYKSSLGGLEESYSGGNYTAYLTSYLSEGLKINALLTKPDGEVPSGGWPAIVFIHGYIPPTQYQTNSEAYSSYVDYLARNGLAVFKIDLRGHGDSEGRPGGGYYSADYVTDALNAYAALQATDFVNPKKIGLWGHSMAGNIILRSAAVKRDIPAIAIWAGAVYSYIDQLKHRINDQSYRPPSNTSEQRNRRQRLYEKVGSPSAQSVFWQQMAATSYLDDLKGAIEIHHAVDDIVVNIGYSRDLMALLDKTSVPHTLYEYESGGHNISGNSFMLAMERTVEFFKKYLD